MLERKLSALMRLAWMAVQWREVASPMVAQGAESYSPASGYESNVPAGYGFVACPQAACDFETGSCASQTNPAYQTWDLSTSIDSYSAET